MTWREGEYSKDYARCTQCGTSRPESTLADGICLDLDWCAREVERRLEVVREFQAHQEEQLAAADERVFRKLSVYAARVEAKRAAAPMPLRAEDSPHCERCGKELTKVNTGRGRKNRYCGQTCKTAVYRARKRAAAK